MNRLLTKARQQEMESIERARQNLVERQSRVSASPGRFSYTIAGLQQTLGERLTAQVELVAPPAHVEADLAIPCFGLAKSMRRSPTEVALELAPKVADSSPLISEAMALGPYVNLKLDRTDFATSLLRTVEGGMENYGISRHGEGALVILDFSSPNIAKPLGVGHLRSTIIGEALARLYTAVGFTVLKDNHIGDWGTQFGKLIVAHARWGEGRTRLTLKELMDLYVRFHQEVEVHPELEDEARAAFGRVEAGEKEAVRLWLKFREISLKQFAAMYERLGVSFDLTLGESFYNEGLNAMVHRAIEQGSAIRGEDGAVAVDLSDPTIPTFLLQKKDGTSLYMTRDLETIRFRVEQFAPQRIEYVVGQEQSLHFRQCFALAARLGLSHGADLKHLPFGLIIKGGAKMSTREGTLVGLEEVLNEAVERARRVVAEKNPDLSGREQEKVAQAVGTGAVIYNDLSQSREKNIAFDWERMLDLRGGSAPYLQYTYVRIQSIFKKLGRRKGETDGAAQLEHPVEWEIVKKLAWWPEVLIGAAEQSALHPITVYLEELAGLFHQFYQTVSVKDATPQFFATRIRLIRAVAHVMKAGLGILGIAAPERM